MVTSRKPPYHINGREVIAETPDLRVQILTLGAGQEVPWHLHSRVTDTFVCLDGPMVVEVADGEADRELQAGESFSVPPQTAHRVTGKDGGPCRFVIVQGVGRYDYVPMAGS